jgi:N-acyl-D-amino-acid deacylase
MSPKRRLAVISLGLILTALFTLAAWFAFAPYRDLDLLITGGVVADGSGGPPRRCDVAIREGRVVGMGSWRFLLSRPKLRIDARNKIVAPGFIDVHTHVEPNLPVSSPFRPANFLRQGVTTLITGNCGRSRTDIAALLRDLEKHGTYINVATLIGHNSIRQDVMGLASRPAAPAEAARMQQLVERAMASGALGLSSGLAYPPGRFAERAEVIALVRMAAEHGGLYVSHLRDEGRGGIEALQEALEIGRRAGAVTHISHFKSSGPAQWHSVSRRLHLLDAARAAGQPVTIDVYPYDRSSTTTDILLPDWAVKENRPELRQAAQDPQTRRRLHADILSKLQQDGWKDLAHICLASGRPEWIGHNLAEAPALASDLDRQIENLIDLSLRGGAQAIYADMAEPDVDRVVVYPHGVFGSDSAVRDPDGQYKPHPRGAGTFPRVFRQYVREKRLLELSQAVRKASEQAAEIFGLEDRGLLRAGAWADVVIFDLEKIKDEADYDQPFAEPAGIDYVIINGVVTVDHGNLTGAAPAGMALRKSKQRPQVFRD